MRGTDRGKDFDEQWEKSRRHGQEKAERGQGPWRDDKYLERVNAQAARRDRRRHAAPDADSCVTALALLGGLAWASVEVLRRLA